MDVNTRYAKQHFFDLIRRAEKGEEFTITRAGVPIARLLPLEPKSIRPLGIARGEVWIADDFDAPLSDDLLREFYGGELPELKKSPKKDYRQKD